MNKILLSAIYTENCINIYWSAENNATGYELKIFSMGGQVIFSQETEADINSLQLRISDHKFKLNSTYFAAVRILFSNEASSWSNPVEFTVNNLALPINEVTCEAGTIIARVINLFNDEAVYKFQIIKKTDPQTDNNLTSSETISPVKGLPATLFNDAKAGTTFQVRSKLWRQNAVTNWSDYSEITIVDVAEPVLQASFLGQSIHCSWQKETTVTGYQLECWITENSPKLIFQKNITQPPFELDITESITKNKKYNIRLRSFTGQCYSSWNNKNIFTGSLSKILKELYDRLAAAYSSSDNQSLTLDAVLLGDAGSNIMTLLKEQLSVDSIQLSSPISLEQDYEHNQILLSGVCIDSLLGIFSSTLTITFSTVTPFTEILINMKFPVDAGWKLTNSFPELSNTYIDSLTFAESQEGLPKFILSSVDNEQKSLISGLNFQGKINVSGALGSLTDLISSVGSTLSLTGSVVRKSSLQTIMLKAQTPDIILAFSNLHTFSFLNPTYVLDIKYDTNSDYITILQYLESTVTLAEISIPLAIKLPNAISGWSIILAPGKVVPLGSIPSFLNFINGLDLSTLLPEAVKALDCFSLTDFNLTFGNDHSKFDSLTFAVDTTSSETSLWEILPCISFTKLKFKLQIYSSTNNKLNYKADIWGVFNLTKKLAVQTQIILPVSSNEWVLNCYSSKPIDSLAAMSSLTGGADIATYLPHNLGNIGQFELIGFTIAYNPKDKKLTRLKFAVNSAAPWILIQNQLTIKRVTMNMQLADPLSDSRALTGMVQGALVIGQGTLEATVKKQTKSSPWLLTVELQQGTTIGLSDIAGIAGITAKDIKSFLPDNLQVLNSLALTDFNLEYDISKKVLNSVLFSFSLTTPWEAIKGYVNFDDIEITTEIINPAQANQILTAQIASTLYLGTEGGGIIFEAAKTNAETDWVFSGILIGDINISFKDLLDKTNLSKTFVLPNEKWLPEINLSELNASMTPQQSIYHIDGKIAINWTIPFVDINFPMKSLGAALDIKHENKEGEKPQNKNKANWFKAIIYGKFEFSTINAIISLQLGSAGVDNIFTAELTRTETEKIQISAVADAFSSGNKGEKWQSITPNDLTSINFSKAFLYFNQSKSNYFIYGRISNFGDTIFYSKNIGKSAAPQKGYIFSFALTENFKFSNLFAALAPIDDILIISKAAVAITSYSIDSAQILVDEINQIVAINDKKGNITNPIRQTGLPQNRIDKGVHLYSKLTLTGPLFSVFNQLISSKTEQLDITLYAYFSTGTEPEKGSANTVFKAIIAPFDLLSGLITFKGIKGTPGVMFEYVSAKSDEFKLQGVISFNVFGKSYDFIGKLTSSNDSTHFKVTTTPETSVTIQLFPEILPPLMVLQKLDLDVNYFYQTATRKEKYLELSVSGTVELVDSVSLTSKLQLLNGKPVWFKLILNRILR